MDLSFEPGFVGHKVPLSTLFALKEGPVMAARGILWQFSVPVSAPFHVLCPVATRG